MNETDKQYILDQGFPEEALEDPTFIEAISRPVRCKMKPLEHCNQCDTLENRLKEIKSNG